MHSVFPCNKYHNLGILIVLLGSILCEGQARVPSASAWKDRLNEMVDTGSLPQDPVDQIVTIAQRHQIPIAIEWLDRPAVKQAKRIDGKQAVISMLRNIVERHPWEEINTDGSLLRISSPEMARSTRNFLNLRIPSFTTENQDLTDAGCLLGSSIRRQLHPEKYPYYSQGGVYSCGGPGYEELVAKGYTVTMYSATVREILDSFVNFRQNVLWVVRLHPEDLIDGRRETTSETDTTIDPRIVWSLLPLRAY